MTIETRFEQGLRSELAVVTADPPAGPRLDDTLRSGRRRRLRRGAGRVVGGAALAVAAVAAVTGIVATWPAEEPTSGESVPQWSVGLPPEDVNERIVDLVTEQLPAGVALDSVLLEAFPAPRPCVEGEPCEVEAVGPGADDRALPRERWDEAAAWVVTITLEGGQQVGVELFHAAGETDGDVAETCAQDLRQEVYLVCEAGTDADSGATTVSRLAALVPDGAGWELADPQRVGPERLWFEQQLEVQPGGDFVIRVAERVQAPDRDQAEQDWLLDQQALAAIGLDGDLVEAG